MEHGVEALLDARVQRAAIRGRERDRQQPARQRVVFLLRVAVRERAAGKADDLERALDALRVARLQACRGLGVEAGEHGGDHAERLGRAASCCHIDAGERVEANRPLGVEHVDQHQAPLILKRNIAQCGGRQAAGHVVAFAVEQQEAFGHELAGEVRQRARFARAHAGGEVQHLAQRAQRRPDRRKAAVGALRVAQH